LDYASIFGSTLSPQDDPLALPHLFPQHPQHQQRRTNPNAIRGSPK